MARNAPAKSKEKKVKMATRGATKGAPKGTGKSTNLTKLGVGKGGKNGANWSSTC